LQHTISFIVLVIISIKSAGMNNLVWCAPSTDVLPNAEVLTKDDNEKNCVNQRLGGNKVISWNTQRHESEVQTNPEHDTESNAFESKLTSSQEDKYPKRDEWTKKQHWSITPFFNRPNGLLQ
jgi:hypothetical protein